MSAARCSLEQQPSSLLKNSRSHALQEASLCRRDLQSWVSMLPKDLAYDIKPTTRLDPQDRAQFTAKCNLHMIYFDTICALNRPWARGEGVDQQQAQEAVRFAAAELTRINKALYGLGMLQYLDATSVANVVAAAVAHLVDAKSPDTQVRDTALQAAKECRTYLCVLRETYGSAKHSLNFIETALGRECQRNPSTPACAAADSERHHVPSAAAVAPSPATDISTDLFRQPSEASERTLTNIPDAWNKLSLEELLSCNSLIGDHEQSADFGSMDISLAF